MSKILSFLVLLFFSPGSLFIEGSIRNVDFYNFDFPFPSQQKPFDKFGNIISVREGKAYSGKEANSLSYLYFKVVEIVYGDLSGDGLEEAAVVAIYGTGSGNFYRTNTYFYTLRNGKPVLLATLTEEDAGRDYTQKYGNKSDYFWESLEGGRKIKGGVFTTKHFAEGGHCCPRSVAALRYRLNGGRIELVGIRKRKVREKDERIKASYDK